MEGGRSGVEGGRPVGEGGWLEGGRTGVKGGCGVKGTRLEGGRPDTLTNSAVWITALDPLWDVRRQRLEHGTVAYYLL